MARLDLGRLVRGAHRRAVEEMLAFAPGSRLEDDRGRTLVGSPGEMQGALRHPITSESIELGAVIGGPEAARAAGLIAHLYEREREKVALAHETLGRYKELTVLYDLSDALSRVLAVDEVARVVVEHAHRLLRADDVAMHLLDRRGEVLEPLVGSAAPIVLGDGIESRVVRSAQAELLEGGADGRPSLLCAPLRSGESVFGILRVASAPGVTWTAGELKLVTSLAGSAASATSHALLHRDQLRQQALRGRIERFVSPLLEEAAFGQASTERSVAVLFCDLSEINAGRVSRIDVTDVDDEVHGPGSSPASSAAALADTISAALCIALDVLLQHGATVNSAHGELLVAVFADAPDLAESAERAVAAAREIGRRLDRRTGGPLASVPGFGVARAEAAGLADPEAVLRGIGIAASLQTLAEGRILADEHVSSLLTHGAPLPPCVVRDDIRGYEVRP